MDRVEILNGLLAESFNHNLMYEQKPSSGEIVEIRMEDIRSDDDLSEESDEPEEEEMNCPIKEEKIETHCVNDQTNIKEEYSNQIECPMGQGQSNTLIKMETNSDCRGIAIWEENNTTDRKVVSSQIIPEPRSQDDLMLNYHNSYSSSYPVNIINETGSPPTTVLEDKNKEVTAENPSEGVLFSLLHTNVSVNLRNQGNSETCQNNKAETVTVQINERPSDDSTISNDTEKNKTSGSTQETDKEKSLLFMLLTSHQEEFKCMKNRLKEKNYKTNVSGGHMSNSGSSQEDHEIQENHNTKCRKQNVNSFHKSKRKQRRNMFKPPLEVLKPIGTNNSKQRDVFKKKITTDRVTHGVVDLTQIPGNFASENSSQKNESNSHPTLCHPTEIAATSSDNLEVFEPIGKNTSNHRDIFDKKRIIDWVTHGVVDATQIPGNFASGNSNQKNESNSDPTLFHPREIAAKSSENLELFKPIGTNNSKQRDVAAKSWKNLAKMFQDAGTMKNKQSGRGRSPDNCKEKNKRELKNKTGIRRKYTPKRNQSQIDQQLQEIQKIIVPVGVHSEKNETNFHNSKRKPEEVFETVGLDSSKQFDGSEKGTSNQQMHLRNRMQKNDPSILLENNVAMPCLNLNKTSQTNGSTPENRSTQVEFGLNHNSSKENTFNMVRKETNVPESLIQNDRTSMLFSLLNNGKGNSSNQLEIGQENQQKLRSPVSIHNTQNDVHVHNSKRKQGNTHVGMFEYVSMDSDNSNQRNVPKKAVENVALKNDCHHNETTNLNKDVDPLENLKSELLQNDEDTTINKYDQYQTDNMLTHNTNIEQNQAPSNGSSMLFSLLVNGRGNSSQPLICQETRENQRKMDSGMICDQQNEVISNNSMRKQGRLKILGNVCLTEAHSPHRDAFEKGRITNKQTEGKGDSVIQLEEDVTSINAVSTAREYLDKISSNPRRNLNKQVLLGSITKSFIESTNMLANQFSERSASALNEAKLPEAAIHDRISQQLLEQKKEDVTSINAVSTAREYLDKISSNPRRNLNKQVLLGSITKSFIESTNMLANQFSERPASALNEAKLPEAAIHDRISQQLLEQSNQKTDIKNVRKNAISTSKKTQRKEIHQKQTHQQSLLNASGQQMNFNINRGKEVLLLDSVKDNREYIAVPKKTDILQGEQTNFAPLAVGKNNVGEVNRTNNIQGNLVPVKTNKGLMYCVVIPKQKNPNREKKDGSNLWIEQINYTQKMKEEQCVLVSSSEDESSDDPTESNKKRKLSKNSTSMVNIAVPKKTDILQGEQTNYAPLAVGQNNVGEVNRTNNIQGNLVPVKTNKGLMYCVVIPKQKNPNREKKDGSNLWIEQINYTQKMKEEQCVLVSSSEDESSDDPTENNKKRKLSKNSTSMVKNVKFPRCSNNERNNVLEKVSHKGKQLIEAVNSANIITVEGRTAQAGIDKKGNSGEQENEVREQNGDSVNRDNIYEDPFDCSSSSDEDILEDNSDIEFTNEDQAEVPKSTEFHKF